MMKILQSLIKSLESYFGLTIKMNKGIPTLEGEEAEKFEKKAQENLDKKHTVDFVKESEMARKILRKGKL
jgi:hypothetical protein